MACHWRCTRNSYVRERTGNYLLHSKAEVTQIGRMCESKSTTGTSREGRKLTRPPNLRNRRPCANRRSVRNGNSGQIIVEAKDIGVPARPRQDSAFGR